MKSFLCCTRNRESGFRVLLLLCPSSSSSLSHLISSSAGDIAPSSPHKAPPPRLRMHPPAAPDNIWTQFSITKLFFFFLKNSLKSPHHHPKKKKKKRAEDKAPIIKHTITSTRHQHFCI